MMRTEPERKLHYLDNASTSFPKPLSVMRGAMDFCIAAGINPGRAKHALAVKAEAMLRGARERLSSFFGGVDPRRLVFGYNATDALNMVIFGFLRRGGHVVTTRLEHNAVLRPIAHCVDDFGAHATLVPFDGSGYVDPDDIRRALRPDTRLVVVTHGSNVLGTVQPVAEIGRICRQAGVPLCVDTAQTAGIIPIDMSAMEIDIVAFTGHKSLLGPMGIGGLCVGEGVDIPHSRAGGTGVDSVRRRHVEEYPYRLECGTPNLLGIAGLAHAQAFFDEQGGVESLHSREMKLMRALWEGLRETPGVKLYGADSLAHHAPLLSFNIRGLGPQEVGRRLEEEFRIACRAGLHCAPLVHEGIGTAPEGTVRFSLGALTSMDEVRAGVAAVQSIAASASGRRAMLGGGVN